MAPSVPGNTNLETKTKDKNNSVVIVVPSVIIGLCVLILLIVFLVDRKRKNDKQNSRLKQYGGKSVITNPHSIIETDDESALKWDDQAVLFSPDAPTPPPLLSPMSPITNETVAANTLLSALPEHFTRHVSKLTDEPVKDEERTEERVTSPALLVNTKFASNSIAS